MKRPTLFSISILTIIFLPTVEGVASGTQASSMPRPACESTFPADTSAAADGVRFNLCRLIEKARLDDLEWPDFQNYREQVQQFYSVNNYALAWVSGNQPTSQALALINLFQNSDRKGLVPKDYDATRGNLVSTQWPLPTRVPLVKRWSVLTLRLPFQPCAISPICTMVEWAGSLSVPIGSKEV